MKSKVYSFSDLSEAIEIPNSIKETKPKEQYQNVVITLNDGTKFYFTGKAVVFPNDERGIMDISFTEPKDLPDDYFFEEISKL